MKCAHAFIPLSREYHTALALVRCAVVAPRDAAIAPELGAALPDIPYISTTTGA